MKISIIKKRGLMALSLALLFSSFTIPAFASDSNTANSNDNAKITTAVVISDPETGEVWKWDIPETDVSISSSTLSNSELSALKSTSLDEGAEVVNKSISVDLGKYLDMTFEPNLIQSRISQSASKDDDITLTTGLTYTANESKNTISVSKVFGSTTPKGLYYASNRKVYWRNPGAAIGGTLKPTSNSWSYSTDSTAGSYNSSLPPYSLLNCEIHISGMTAYREVSIQCQIP